MVTILPGIALRAALEAGSIRAHRFKPAPVRSIAWVSNPRRVVSSAMQAVMDIISEDLQVAADAACGLGRR
jgi:DNA-binding transcriptional LysR family regulator